LKTKEYLENYTGGYGIRFKSVLREILELLNEIIAFDRVKIKEEWQDVLHHFQLWLCWRFGINGEIWKCTEESVAKFVARKQVWRKIYKFAGLDENISNFCGNYKRKEKVIKQLGRFGIEPNLAEKAYNKVVSNK
jgi:hypothetical protein